MMTRGASKQTRKLSSVLSRLSEEIIQDFSVRPKSRSEATGAARNEQPREQKTFHKASRRGGDSTSTEGAQDSTLTGSTRHADRSINAFMSASRSAR